MRATSRRSSRSTSLVGPRPGPGPGPTRVLVLGAAVLLLAAGCGSAPAGGDASSSAPASEAEGSSPTPAAVDTASAAGDWLLGMSRAGGADGERSTTVYVSYDPSTGRATARAMPGVQAASATPREAALLVSADRRWAIPDTGIPTAQERSGRLRVYPLAGGPATVVDVRERTGEASLKALGWAFDPERPGVLRVVDSRNRVWLTEVNGTTATRDGSLPSGPWVFTNGFDPADGRPWVESIEDDTTRPAGNGTTDARPVTRAGGQVLAAGSAALDALPAGPCRLGAGFTDAQGTTWSFCADGARVSAYHLATGARTWQAWGQPSDPVAPEAADFPLVLPPVG